jgi:hypothetical protein
MMDFCVVVKAEPVGLRSCSKHDGVLQVPGCLRRVNLDEVDIVKVVP